MESRNLGKWYRRACLQNRNRGAEVKSRHVDTSAEGEGGVNWDIRIDTYTLTCKTASSVAQGAQLGAL